MRINGPIQLFPLLRIAVFLAAGVFLGYETDALLGRYGEWVSLGAFVVSVVLAVCLRRHEVLQGALLCLASLLLGMTLVVHQNRSLQRPLPADTVTYEAVVSSEPQQRGKVMRMDLWTVGEETMPRKVKASILCDTMAQLPLNLHVGDGIIASSRLEVPENYYHSQFDYPLYLRCHGFTATTLILPGNWRKAPVSLTSLSYLDRTILAAMKFRQQTLRHYLSLGLDDEDMAIAVAMALGDRSRLTNDLRDIYSISGASHVLALSGLHLGIIYILLSLLAGVRRSGMWREWLVIAGIWSYAVFTGLSPSVVRASTMITIYSMAGMLHRQRMSLNALGLTAIIMLVANPMCLYDVGFQMSFMAVLAILVFYKPVYGLVSSEYLFAHPVIKWIWAMVVVSCCAQLGVAPLTAYYFGRFSVYFLLTNFIVIPLATLVLYLTAAMLAASLLPSLLPWVAKALAAVVGCQTQMVRWVSSLPGASIEPITINRLQVLMIYVFLAAASVVVYKVLKLKNRI